MASNADLITNFEATELRLGLPGTDDLPEKHFLSYNSVSSSSSKTTNKRASSEMTEESRVTTNFSALDSEYATPEVAPPPAKAQVVGWPPIRSYRRNNLLQTKKMETDGGGMFVKVSKDGAPYLRKIDLKGYKSYPELLKALESMFKFTIGEFSEREGYNGSEFVPTYEDKDGDWMLVGDVPWGMFISTCKRLRIMKGSEAKGLCI